MTHLLDTSAVLAHYLNEPGAQRIEDLVRDPSAVLGISTLTLYEFQIRLMREAISLVDRRLVVER